jgi:hypothetical protein
MKPWIDQLVRDSDDLTAAFHDAYEIMHKQKVTGHIIFQQFQNKRSLAQNRLMWLWNHEIAQWITDNTEMEVDQDDVHEYLCKKFWPKIINPLTKEPKRARTHKFKVPEMRQHLEHMEFWAGKKEIPLTQPFDYNCAMHGEK